MNKSFDDILLEILEELVDGKGVDISAYCKKYPQHKDKILTKFRTAEFLKKNFQEEDLSGKKLGEYLILQELGRGGMGIVFLGIQPALSRLTAVKVLPPSFTYDKEALANFQEEAKVIAKFNHPNIVPVYSISQERGLYYIAMGYISGSSLKNIIEQLEIRRMPGRMMATAVRDIIQTTPIDKQDISQKSITLKRGFKFWDKPYYHFVATIGAEVADALNYAHQNGISHGDLKPSNILLTNEGIPVIVDFGLSKDVKKLASQRSKDFTGTLAYAAPEQIRENAIDHKTDIWSLGVTLYEMLTFKNPFREGTVKKTIDKILKSHPPLPRHYNKKIPIELDAIVIKCLEHNPKDRYASMEDLTTDLNNFIESKPIKARPGSILGKTQKAIRRKPIIAILILCVFLTLIAAFSSGLKITIDNYYYDIHSFITEGKVNESVEMYNKMEIIGKFYPYAKQKLPFVAEAIGITFQNKKDYENMATFYQKAIEQKPDSWPAHQGLGKYYSEKRMLDKALYHYKLAYDNLPANRNNILYEIANTLHLQGIKSSELKLVKACLSNAGYGKEEISEIWQYLMAIETSGPRSLNQDEEKLIKDAQREFESIK